MKYTINTIIDIELINKLVLTDENGLSKLWHFKFYPFDREIRQVSNVEVYEIEADTFNHAIDIIRYKLSLSDSEDAYDSLKIKLKLYEDIILKSRVLKLVGKSREARLNSFLRR